jgi:arsenite/tail-anchored protein-transporting ATPase
MNDLFELAPPGVDELVAIIEVTDALLSGGHHRGFDLVIIDTAPTGHALRLLEMPALVHQWVKAVMAILLKYQAVVGVGELGAVLLRLSRGLNRLRDLLSDETRTAFVVVTRAAQLPRAETVRLVARLRAASIHVPLVVVNAFGAGTCDRCRRERQAQTRELTALGRDLRNGRAARSSLAVTPGWIPPPGGIRDLRAFATEWRRAAHSRR